MPKHTTAASAAKAPCRVVIVTLDNRACELAVLAMKSCFGADDLVGGLREGVTLLAEHARAPRVLHLDDNV